MNTNLIKKSLMEVSPRTATIKVVKDFEDYLTFVLYDYPLGATITIHDHCEKTEWWIVAAGFSETLYNFDAVKDSVKNRFARIRIIKEMEEMTKKEGGR